MRRKASSQVTGAALLIVGLVAGAGLVFITTYVNGGPSSRTVVETSTLVQTTTSTLVTTLTLYTRSGVTTGTAQIQASAQSCASDGGAPPAEACDVVLTNTGNSAASATASCSISWGGVGHTGVFAPTSAVTPGNTLAGTCTAASAAGLANPGLQVTGFVIMSNGANALWSTTAS